MDERDVAMVGGVDAATWRENMRNGYVRTHLLYALEETGVFEALRRAASPMTAEEIAAACKIDLRLLDGALNYLAFSDIVLTKEDNRFALTDRGREWLGQDLTLNMTYMMAAYGPQLEQLVPALRGEKTYGKDFVRSGSLLAYASLKGTRANYPWIINQMKSLGVEVVADLGCGAGGLIAEFCQLEPKLRGIGIDIDAGAVETARANMKSQGLADRVRVVQGDITNPRTFAEQIQDVQAFNALGVIHEFLRDGEERVERMFREMKELFPGRYYFMGEYNPVSDAGWASYAPKDRLKRLHYQHIMHPLSLQGMPMARERWLALFERVGIECVLTKEFFADEFVLRF